MLTDFIQTDKITALMTELVTKKTVFNSIARVTMNFKGSELQVPLYAGGTLRDYVGGKLTVDDAASSKITIAIDQKKYMNVLIDGVDNEMSAQDVMPQVLNDMTNKLRTAQDTYALDQIATTAGVTDASIGVTGTPLAVTDEASTKAFYKAWKVIFDKNDMVDPYLVVNPEIAALSLEMKGFSNAQASNDTALSYGEIGSIYGITVYSSNNLPAGAVGERKIVGGVKNASDVVFGFDKMKNGDGGIEYEGEYVRGIAVYGAGANNTNLVAVGFVSE